MTRVGGRAKQNSQGRAGSMLWKGQCARTKLPGEPHCKNLWGRPHVHSGRRWEGSMTEAIFSFHVVGMELNFLYDTVHLPQFGGENTCVLELNVMSWIDAMFCHSWYVWMFKMCLMVVLLNSGVTRAACLPCVDLTTFTWDAVYLWCFEFWVILHWLREAGDFPWQESNRLDVPGHRVGKQLSQDHCRVEQPTQEYWEPYEAAVTVALLPQCDVDRLQVSMQVVLVVQSSSPVYQGGRYSVTLLFINVLILTTGC
jgi:hypothetical protein